VFSKIIMDGGPYSISQDEMDSLFLPDTGNHRTASVYGKIALLMKDGQSFDTLDIEELWIALLPLLLQETSSTTGYPIEQEKVLSLIEGGNFDLLPEDTFYDLLTDLSGALAKKYM